MSKTLETKRKILAILNKKDMTLTQLSQELGLSTATVSQHMNDLAKTGSVEKIENKHFRKMKYYRAVHQDSMHLAKYALGAAIAVVFLGALLFYYQSYTAQAPYATTTIIATQGTTSLPSGNASANSVSAQNSSAAVISGTGPGTGPGVACPMINYRITGRITNESGFSVYYINDSSGSWVADYVIANGTSGTISISESITVLPGASGSRQHYAYLSMPSGAIPNDSGVSISISPGNYALANANMSAMASITISPTAPSESYWLHIDGPCGGGMNPAVLTIGNAPYSGTMPVPVGIYG